VDAAEPAYVINSQSPANQIFNCTAVELSHPMGDINK
jgi:hypothetical protein